MKQIVQSLIVLLIMSTECSPSLATIVMDKEYYAHLPFRETPFADIRGIYPISKEKASHYKHFEIRYDQLRRPLEVLFKQGNQIVPLNISRNVVTYAPNIRIEYQDNKEIRHFFDTSGNPVTSNGSFKEVFELDNNGDRHSLKFYDFQNQQIENNWGIYEYSWSIDRSGTVTERRTNKAGEFVEIRPHFSFFCLKLHYNQKGLLALMENYGLDCQSLTMNNQNGAQDKLEFNAFGGLVAWNVYDDNQERSVGNGPKVARGILELDKNGNSLREYYQNEVGKMMANAYGWTDTYATFDESGNMTSRYNYDSNGKKAMNTSLGYSGYKITYDPQGIHRIHLSYYDEKDNPVVHSQRGYHSVATQYDKKGNRSKIDFFDIDGKPVNRIDTCAASMQYSFDQHNRIKSVKLFDKNNKPTTHCKQNWRERNYSYFKDGPLKNIESK